jgi:hypothetical protein
VSRPIAGLAFLLTLFAGCASNDAKEARTAFEQIQADVENKNVEGVWERIDKRSQERLAQVVKKASRKDARADVNAVKAAALAQLSSKLLRAKFQDIRTGANRATVILERPAKGEGDGAETVDMMKEAKLWKVVLYTD